MGGVPVSYVLQRINKYVFKNPELVMENICAVTEFLRKKIEAAGGNTERETLTVIATKDGKNFFIDENGEYWRVYNYIDGASSYDCVQNAQHLYNAGYAFGRFQNQLADFPIETLHGKLLPFSSILMPFFVFMPFLHLFRKKDFPFSFGCAIMIEESHSYRTIVIKRRAAHDTF